MPAQQVGRAAGGASGGSRGLKMKVDGTSNVGTAAPPRSCSEAAPVTPSETASRGWGRARARSMRCGHVRRRLPAVVQRRVALPAAREKGAAA